MLKPTSNWILAELVQVDTKIIIPGSVNTIPKHVYARGVGPEVTSVQVGDELLVSHGAKMQPIPDLWEDEKVDGLFCIRESDVFACRANAAAPLLLVCDSDV